MVYMPSEIPFWKYIKVVGLVALTAFLVCLTYETVIRAPDNNMNNILPAIQMNNVYDIPTNVAVEGGDLRTLIDKLRERNIQANFSFNYMLQGKDPCIVWRELHGWTIGTAWWQKLCELESDWETMDYQCKDMRMMGNWPVCFDPNLISNASCLVYSFGIANDFRFDDAMADFGCTVYSFDPSMKAQDHQHAPRVFFKNTGISGHDDDKFNPRVDGYVRENPTTWRVRRLTTIMKELGHAPGTLTVFKMDIESNEWEVLSDMLASNIFPSLPQVLIEWHMFPDAPPRSSYATLFENYFRFKNLGFRKFWMRNEGRTHTIERLHTQAETAFVNNKFLQTKTKI